MRVLLFMLSCLCGLAQNPFDLAAFTPILYPTQVAGLKLWLSADFGCYSNTSLNECTNNTTVALWKDQSGIGNDVGQVTDAKKPKFFTNQINGLPAVAFGVGTSVLTNFFTPPYEQPTTIFLVFYPSNATSGLICSDPSAGNGSPRIQWTSTPNLRMSYGGSGLLEALPIKQFPVWYEATCLFRSNVSTLFVFSKNRFLNNPALETNSCRGFTIGGLQNGTPVFNGKIAEFIMYGERLLKPYEQLGIEMYLKRKYALPDPF